MSNFVIPSEIDWLSFCLDVYVYDMAIKLG